MVQSLIANVGRDAAMRTATGGDFKAIGILERELLIQEGLPRDGYLIDVGCGSGRLASPLSDYLIGRYLGIDIVPAMVRHARRLVRRSDWRFEVAAGLSIPEKDHTADMVCFFSVFTHLLPEQSFVYLQESVRVLKPEGKIVFSFLEFEEPAHWPIFENAIRVLDDASHPLTTFTERSAIRTWAAHLDLKIEAIVDAGAPHINLERPLTLDNGTLLQGKVAFGQSVCILTAG